MQFLSDPIFASRYIRKLPNGLSRVLFFIDGIHCGACVWLLERLPELCPGIATASVNLSLSLLTVDYNEAQIELPAIAAQIKAFGYTPHPLQPDERRDTHSAGERLTLLRLGVAAVGAMNTMLFAVSLYQGWFSGMEAGVVRFFTAVSFLLSLPVVLFSAMPLYRSAFAGLRRGILHIDLPLSVAIVFGFTISTVNTLLGKSEVYFDTVTMLVFLLLAARYLQQRGLSASAAHLSLLGSLAPLAATRIEETGDTEIYIERIMRGDLLRVAPGERIPVDGVVRRGESAVDQSLLTGESQWRRVVSGSAVFGGTVNCESGIEVEASETLSSSRIGKLIAELERIPVARSRLADLSDRLAKQFAFAVLMLALFGGAFWFVAAGSAKALSVVLALLVVSCPCALGLAAPLATCAAIRSAARSGIFLKDAAILDRLRDLKFVAFDKTGVLTEDTVRVSKVFMFRAGRFDSLAPEAAREELREEALFAIAALESGNRHPVGRALSAFTKMRTDATCGIASIEDRTAVLGKGVCARVHGVEWKIGSESFFQDSGISVPRLPAPETKLATTVILGRDGVFVAAFRLESPLRQGIKEVVEQIQARGLEVYVISGDTEVPTKACGSALGINEQHILWERSPLEKADIVRELQNRGPVMMIGDGANDSAALQLASIGIAVGAAPDVALESASVSMSPFSANQITALFEGAERCNSIIRINFGISSIYNALGAAFALAGRMNPMVAAILMPASSLTVVFTTLKLTRIGIRTQKSRAGRHRSGE